MFKQKTSLILEISLNFEKTDKFDVLRSRLLGNHNDFHWQLGGQINHQPTKQLES